MCACKVHQCARGFMPNNKLFIHLGLYREIPYLDLFLLTSPNGLGQVKKTSLSVNKEGIKIQNNI